MIIFQFHRFQFWQQQMQNSQCVEFHPCVIRRRGQRAHGGGIASKRPIGEGINDVQRMAHLSAITTGSNHRGCRA